jgi:Mg/Co/Ni transporter MgtE
MIRGTTMTRAEKMSRIMPRGKDVQNHAQSKEKAIEQDKKYDLCADKTLDEVEDLHGHIHINEIIR